MTVTDYGEIVDALRAVPGVADADVEPDESGDGLGLLRLGLEADADEVAVASTVGKLLRERFGLGVDADGVQLIEEAPASGPPPPRDARRPAITRMQLVSSGLEVTATVALSFRDLSTTGQSTGTATQSGVHRAVANATLHAVEELVGSAARFELEHVDVAATGVDRTVLVTVTMVSGTGTDRLTGSAGVRDDVRQAVIRATLDALNRRLDRLLES